MSKQAHKCTKSKSSVVCNTRTENPSARKRRVAVLMVTHDLVSAVDIADRIGFLIAGRIEEESEAQAGSTRFDLNALHDRYTHAGRAA